MKTITLLISVSMVLLTPSLLAMNSDEQTAEQTARKLNACNECIQQCEVCIKHGPTDCISICRDCADICSLVAQIIMKGGYFAEPAWEVCPEVVKACEKECSKNAHDESCQSCAAACRRLINTWHELSSDEAHKVNK